MWMSKVKAKQEVNQCEYVSPALSIGPINPYNTVLIKHSLSTYIDSSIIGGSPMPYGKNHPSPKYFKVEIGFFLSCCIDDGVFVHVLIVDILYFTRFIICKNLLAPKHRQTNTPKRST